MGRVIKGRIDVLDIIGTGASLARLGNFRAEPSLAPGSTRLVDKILGSDLFTIGVFKILTFQF